MVTLSEYTGKNITTMSQLTSLYRLYTVYSSLGKSLPHWAKKMIQSGGELHRAAVLTYTLRSHPIRINGGKCRSKLYER